MKNVLFFVGLLVLSIQAYAQEFKLSGTVTENGVPLNEASVYIKSTGTGTLTDEDGNYSLSLEDGTYTVVFVFGNQKSKRVVIDSDKTLNIDLSGAEESLDEVFLSAVRVTEKSPITYSNLSNEEIEDRNLGQDIPVLMSYMPNVVTTTDAGAGVGYTGIRVRGSDATRVNVTINGIPYNDAESQGSFWVNLGDFASSVENLQLQRGVGTSTNGAGAFGASLNILTDSYKEEAQGEIANSIGSYNTFKHTVKFSTGLINDHFSFSGRASKIKSDGYIDRASSDLKSYFLQGTFVDDNTLIKALTFGGSERTYQAWYGIDKETLENDRTFNPAGIYTDENGNTKFYDNQTDNYKQDHYQLLWNQDYNSNWSSNIAFHYTYGRGYYEEYNEDADLAEFGLPTFVAEGEEVTTSDIVGTKWLDNHFYGTVFSLNYENTNWDVTLGGGLNRYEGDHFGEVLYTRFARNNDPYEPYYFNQADKTDFNIYGKANFAITEKLAGYADLQLRTVSYETHGMLDDQSSFLNDDSFSFFNPKAGITYEINPFNQLYLSYAKAHREPSRNDYENGDPEPEELNDFELGWRHNSQNFQVNTNLYYMDYQNQLVLTGGIDDVGAFIRQNSGNSYRLGLEIDATVRLSDKFSVRPNISLSQNKNVDFVSTFNGELQEYGNTDISYSPEIVAGNIFNYEPINGLELNLLSKYIGEQFMSNVEAENSKLDSYFVNDFNVQYSWEQPWVFKEIVITGLVNNIFNEKYVSNGYYFTFNVPNEDIPSGVQTLDGAGYYPQATTNFLLGLTLKF
ncbi:TonB-dependent receptor [Christiangramia forsetii]|uniref:TonB-dependent outer membrane receptor n=2 Tax=Christiangramia forsetii TaxID=411153 RepID=A0M5U9_CHRFK|nr:TonB-dependent receptor [Christiangramia forsetii]GGG32116.1 TonB-dependent receptor [Christiangramia forsetii]CAL67994.1 TonB-dependent outer membrane receptor [Christiangramia forsetii KT0803]